MLDVSRVPLKAVTNRHYKNWSLLMSTCYDSSLLSLPFYSSHSYMLPFVGDDYDSPKYKKLLLVGESHYVPEGSTVHHDANAW